MYCQAMNFMVSFFVSPLCELICVASPAHRYWPVLACGFSLVIQGTAFAASPPELSVPLPPGMTPLTDIGVYRVGWQSYGQAPETMPLSWMGHFDERTGISCQPWGRVSGRNALLMHSPWHVPPGRVWVEYPLSLPHVTPIRLSFGIAMGPDVAVPGKSDGVTFSCQLVADGQERELMRQHHDKAEWRNYSFDLSAHAGRTIAVRLQVEPGPKNNASWDYSFFGDARITAGEGEESQAEVLKRLTGTRAYQAVDTASRVALSNTPKQGVAPSSLLPGRNSLEQAGSTWRFIYQGDDCRVVYSYEPSSGTLSDFRVQVDDRPVFQPALDGGATAAFTQGGKTDQVPLRGGKLVNASRNGDTLEVLWEYGLKSRPVRLAWTFRVFHKALVVAARCDEPVVSRFSLGGIGLAPLRRTFNVPYLLGSLHYLAAQNVFVCRYLDWTASHASTCPQGVATYDTKTDGTRNLLVESGYIAVSPDVGEVLPNIPHPPSPFLSVLGSRVMLDIWGHHQGAYAGDAAKLRELKDNGVDHLVIIQHDWQRYGYDVKLPDHLPANPQYGGEEGMKLFGKVANECGYLWSLHENYIDLYPDAPSYDAAARVLLGDGSPSKAWYNPGTKVQSFGLKCNRALGYAKQNSPEAHRRYATTAAYLDVHTCVPPWHQLDHDATQPMAAMARLKVQRDTELFQFERDMHGGPLFGEGANHFYWAGRCDGVEAQVVGGEDHAAFLDFDLLKLHPQMVNHGMGYYERWFRRGYETQYGVDAGSVEQWDKYRAMELAYGHAGFLGNVLVHTVQAVVREHHLMHPVQRLYGTGKPVDIRYEIGGRLVSASAALVVGDTSRQHIRYDSGLRLWVNWRAEPWRVEGRVLPQWGFLALGPNTDVSTRLQEGKVADYAECPEYVFADARTWFDLPYVRAKKDIEPRLRSLKYIGANRVQVTYEWTVNDALEADYHCFVHAVNRASQGVDQIAFQGDHPLAKPTSQWRKGDVIVDGPHELAVSEQHDTYGLVMGLYKGDRVRLKGIQEGENRILIAQLKLERKDGWIVHIAADKPASRPADGGVVEADFNAHRNPEGAWIDFGKVATDGAVKINREKDRLILFPYPRDKKFRVSLDLKALAPSADLARTQVRALASVTQQDLGAATFSIENGRLTLTAGLRGAGRYVVTWK